MGLFKFIMMTIFIGCVQSLRQRVFFLYDSHYTGHASENLDIQLVNLYDHNESEFKVNIVQMEQQRGVAECGLFAAAGFNPSSSY